MASAASFRTHATDHLHAVAGAPTLTVPVEVEVGTGSAGAGTATIWCKLELQLPSGSTKDRIAAHILSRAIADGIVVPSTHVVEASSGSTSISFAMLCASLGLAFTAVMPEGVSEERLLIIRRYGGVSHLTPAADGVLGSIDAVHAMIEADDAMFWPDQFHNVRNAESHQLATGPQLVEHVRAATGGALDGFVAAVGTGGTLMGVGRAVRASSPGAVIARVRVDGEADAEQGGVPCGIAGVVDCLSGVLDPAELSMPQDLLVTRAEALAATKQLCAWGFPVGPSSGLNFVGAVRLATRLGAGAHVATVFCDRMERYFSTDLFDDVTDGPTPNR
jgi:cysteine synthase A